MPTPPFKKVLVANRGEIAVRIMRTLRALDVPHVLLCHPLDRHTLAAREAELAGDVAEVQGDPPVSAYLDIEQILDVCRGHGVDAVHPGYGFLSESPAFARALEAEGIAFMGPPAAAIEAMGDKISARKLAAAQGLPVGEGVHEDSQPDRFADAAARLGLPLLLKAAAGGGGRGMRIVREAGELAPQIETARSEASRAFGDGRLYAERYWEGARHIEVQVLADRSGNVIHLGERDCSVQRRFQKVIEEAPAPGLEPAVREGLHAAAVLLAQSIGYVGAGTVEFLVAPDGGIAFLEMNTRLQVEHPVTEAITGLDLVVEQVRIAAGEPLGLTQDDVAFNGHAVECRLYAEQPELDFAPATGRVLNLDVPEGAGLRFDAGIMEGQVVTAAFDPLLAKLIGFGNTRATALERARGALERLVLLGVPNNCGYLARVLGHELFADGAVSTHFLQNHAAALAVPPPAKAEQAALIAAAALTTGNVPPCLPAPYGAMGPWRN